MITYTTRKQQCTKYTHDIMIFLSREKYFVYERKRSGERTLRNILKCKEKVVCFVSINCNNMIENK